MNDLPSEVERILEADAVECAHRTTRYKFGRLSTKRIVGLLRGVAPAPLHQSDAELVELWFAKYDRYLHDLRTNKSA